MQRRDASHHHRTCSAVSATGHPAIAAPREFAGRTGQTRRGGIVAVEARRAWHALPRGSRGTGWERRMQHLWLT
jgi:hypothetical protein